MKRTKPKTSEEAEALTKAAIEGGDYKGAKWYYSFVEFLKNFEQTRGVSDNVADYLYAKDELANNVYANVDKYGEDIENAKQFSSAFYKKEFIKMRNIHRYELEELVEQWDEQRQKIYNRVNNDYQNTLVTAKIVADTHNFDAAIKLKDNAEKVLRFGGKEDLKQLDQKNTALANLMIERQNEEIQNLITNHETELRLFDDMYEAAKVQALESFYVENAVEVMKAMEKFPKEVSAPLSLKLQIKKNMPQKPANETKFNPSSYKKFSRTMHQMSRAFQEPVDVE